MRQPSISSRQPHHSLQLAPQPKPRLARLLAPVLAAGLAIPLAPALGAAPAQDLPTAQAGTATALFSGTSGTSGVVRAGRVWLKANATDQTAVTWKPIWLADANAERLYLVDGSGHLVEQRNIAATETSGSHTFQTSQAAADYLLAVPGYTFRGYAVTAGPNTAIQFEPPRVHVAADLPAGTELYFNVPANTSVALAGKYHDGITALKATRVQTGTSVSLTLSQSLAYKDYNKVSVPTATTAQVWKLTFTGSGKVGFWLEGVSPGLFAPKAEYLHTLTYGSQSTTLTVLAGQAGQSPAVGVAVPYLVPPQASINLLSDLGIQSVSQYSFVDRLATNPNRETAQRQVYTDQMGLTQDVTLLSATTGSRLTANSTTLTALDYWLADTKRLKAGGTHYLAFADEPNLNYPDYATFKAYFDTMLQRVEATAGVDQAGVRIAAPASSRFTGGPFIDGAASKRGIDWASQLLATYGDRIDAVSWHEWMVRDLLATRQYRDTIQAAAALVGLDANGRPKKDLIISQTNISSGSSISAYEQDGEWAALWWASVVINSSADGLLTVLNWFQAADSESAAKGMLDINGTVVKPVGYAQAFLARHWASTVYNLGNDGFDVDAVLLGDGDKRILLGVNKSSAARPIKLTGLVPTCATTVKLYFLNNTTGTETTSNVACSGSGERTGTVAPGGIFALEWTQTAAQPPALTSVKLNGNGVIGATLTAQVVYSPATAAVTYQWFRGTKLINGVTGPSYTLTTADAGQDIVLKVTVTSAGTTTPAKYSNHVLVLGVSSTTLTGTARVGYTLTAQVAYLPADATVTYQWFRGTKLISGVTGSAYRLTLADAGQDLVVKVMVTKAGVTSPAKYTNHVIVA
ncbi:MAG: hypothetical protein LBR19_02150 [Bifidobacteriaceae bacterium]|jgi:hypothetical protein|nr:hypothetical protein [Bifidobacteriaceae bacterium]